MVTFLTIPKPFRGHIALTQRNALESWTRLGPDVEVIVFGAEEGTAEACRELGLRHASQIECNEFGTPLLNYAFNQAQAIARHDWLCYANCDIVLTPDFTRAFERLKAWHDSFLMVGQRTDIDITAPLDFSQVDWERSLRELASARGNRRPLDWIDYFLFRRGTFTGMPPFAVGRLVWDWWVIWRMRSTGCAVVDTTPVVLAVHQNHEYTQHPEGLPGINKSEEFKRNRALVGSWRHLNTIEDASHVLEVSGIRRTYRHWGKQFEREREHFWNRFLVATGPLRHRLGLRKENLGGLFKAK